MSKVDKFVDGMEKVKDGADKIFCEDIPEEEVEGKENRKRKKHKTRRLSMWKIKMIGLLIVVCLIAGLILKWKASGWFDGLWDSMNGENISVTEAALIKTLDINELATVSYDYSSVAKVPWKFLWTTKEHCVAYEAEVRVGIDFSKVEIVVDQENGEIKVKLPDVAVLDASVEPSSLDFLDDSDKKDEELVVESIKKCSEDVLSKVEKEQAMFDVAEENAERTIEGLFEPVLSSTEKEYNIIFE